MQKQLPEKHKIATTCYGHMPIMYFITMTRPVCCRKIGCIPNVSDFKPQGKAASLETVILSLDEFEAIKLADYEGQYQESAAKGMNISRQTFGRIIDTAHKKIADVLINGKSLKIEGGSVAIDAVPAATCKKCPQLRSDAANAVIPEKCRQCKKFNFNKLRSSL
jgi:uncharacterized protein